MLDLSEIDNRFPIRVDGKASYREGQREAIEFTLNAFNNGKKIVILEGPTGSGKSAIGMTVVDMFDKSYYLTATKILQDQLIKEFGDSVVELKGRNAYPCTFYTRFGPQMVTRGIWTTQQLNSYLEKNLGCNEGFCKTKTNKTQSNSKFKCLKCFTPDGPNGNRRPSGDLELLPLGMRYSACPYYEQVYQAVNSRKVTMNFSSFLFQTQMTKRFDEPRDVMVIDESHQVESQLLDFVSLTISDAHLSQYGIYIPKLDNPLEYAVWFEDSKIGEHIYEVIEQARENDQFWLEDELSRTLKKYKMFLAHVQNTEAEWIHEYEETQTGSRKVTLKPVFVHGTAHQLLFKYAHKIVMMSATILDVDIMCKSLGINREHVAAIRLKNRFPVENRPIYLKPVAKMTGGKQGMGTWGPELVKGVNEIVDKYIGKKGIIHTHNFAIQELLKVRCVPWVKSRFLFQQDFRDKTEMLEEHARRIDSVIVAPAMHEGIDLHGDLSRFQIICKIPYANCFDNEQLARRVEIDRKYYIWITALKLVQSYGRSIRSETDYADTYILDESIYKFMKDAHKMLPSWFTEAINETPPF